MEKIKYFMARAGKKIFPGLAGRGRTLAAAWLAAGAAMVIFSLAGAGLSCHSAAGQAEKYRRIAGAYVRVYAMLEEGRAQAQEGAEEAGKNRMEAAEGIALAYDWESLSGINGDILGWLTIPGSLIDFPVVGTADNDFYLSHDFEGKEDSAGCPFMDKGTRMDDFNRVVYGHNMGSGSDAMFSTLLDFEDEGYFEGNRAMYFAESFGRAEAYGIVAVVKYDVKDVGEWDFRVRNHGNMEDYNAWFEQLQERALYYREPEKAPDRILVLSTCDRREYGRDGRFLVVGALSY